MLLDLARSAYAARRGLRRKILTQRLLPQRARRATGTHWANLVTRLTALIIVSSLRNGHSWNATERISLKHFAKNHARKVNGFWVVVCQYVPFRAEVSAENPIDCRIFFADNPQRKIESGIGGKKP
jgi:hypothetical protein